MKSLGDIRAAASPAPDGEPLIVFIEIAETGARALRSVAVQRYSKEAGQPLGDIFQGSDQVRASLSRLAGRPEGIRFAFGQIPVGLAKASLPPDSRYITLLRDPVQRVLAQFRALQKRERERNLDMLEVVTSVGSVEDAAARLPHLFANGTTRLLSGLISPFGELPPEGLDRAKQNLRDDFALVGIAERLNESLELLTRELGGGDPPAKQPEPPVDEEVAAQVRALLEHHNALDLELYSYARELFETRVARPPDGLRSSTKARRFDLPFRRARAKRRPARRTPLVVYLEMPRTGGSTVRKILAQGYGDDGVRLLGNVFRNPKETAAKVRGLAGAGDREIRAVIGQIPFGLLSAHLPANTRYVTFVREPVGRVVSGLDLDPGTDEDAPVHSPAIDNLATRLLCGIKAPFGDLPEGALDEAKRNLREGFEFVGIAERMDESLALLTRRLDLPGLAASPNLKRPADRRLADTLPEERRYMIEEENRLDLELYDYCLELFDEQLAAAGDPLPGETRARQPATAAGALPAGAESTLGAVGASVESPTRPDPGSSAAHRSAGGPDRAEKRHTPKSGSADRVDPEELERVLDDIGRTVAGLRNLSAEPSPTASDELA